MSAYYTGSLPIESPQPTSATHVTYRERDVTRRPKQGYQWPHKKDSCPPKIFTARIRRMGEGNVLTRVCPSVCPQGGGVGQRMGGVGQVQPGGRGGSAGGEGWVRSSREGGVGQLGGRGGSAGGEGWVSRGRGGSAGGRGGSAGGGVGQPGGRGGSATGGRGGLGPGGRYASCVHAGGLSCLKKCFQEKLK